MWKFFKFIYYKRRKQEISCSRQAFSKKVKYLIDDVMSYSYFPLRLISITNIIVILLGFLYGVIIFFVRFFGNIRVTV